MTKKQYSLMLVLALVAGLVGGVVSSQFLVGQPAFAEKRHEKVIMSQMFALVDENGQFRGEFGLTPTGVSLSLIEGKEVRASLALRPDGTIGLGFRDNDGEFRFILSVTAEATLFDILAGEKGGIQMAYDKNTGVQSLAFIDKSGRGRAVFALKPDGAPKIAFQDEKGNVIWQAP